jgi:hypothetical protein
VGVAIRIVLLTAVAAFGCHARQESIAPRPDAKQDPIADSEDARERSTPTRDRESEPVRGPARGQLGSEPFELVKSLAESIDGQHWRLRLMNYAGTCEGEQPPGSAEFVIVVERTTDAQRIPYDPFGQLNVLRRHFGGVIGSVGIEAEVELEALGQPGSRVHASVRITDKGEPLPSTLEGEVEIEICPGVHASARPTIGSARHAGQPRSERRTSTR